MSGVHSVGPSPTVPRRLNAIRVFLHGLLLGSICSIIAELMIPSAIGSLEEYDLARARCLGIVYASATGLWLGWCKGSRWNMKWGAAIGLLIGTAYFVLSAACELIGVGLGSV